MATTFTLGDGNTMPAIGLGTFQIPDADVIARLLQEETDRVIGPGQATVVLDTVIIHAT